MQKVENEIKYLFEPRSVAVIGASQNPDKIGYKILSNIVTGGYKGKIYPVNPQGGAALKIPFVKSMDDIKGDVDMASISIPAPLVFDSLQSCAARHVKFLSIITSGFSEIGNNDEEKKITEFARANNMRILGPNIFGYFSAQGSLNAAFGPANVKYGSVALLTQSGALGVAMIGKTAVENIGLSAIISMGNKADLDESDILDYLIDDDNTKVIMMYIEGVKAGERLIRSLKAITLKKPVVVVKSGRSKRGAIAAASHTGSLAGSDAIFTDVMKQCNVLRAESIKEALEWCKFFANSPRPKGDNAVIVTNGGGIGVLATDACEKYGIKLYDDYESLKKTFSKVTPYFGSVKNPIDLTGQATGDLYGAAFTAGLKNKDINALISLYCETAVLNMDQLEPIIEDAYAKFKAAGKPIVFSLVGGVAVEDCVSRLRQKDIPASNDPYDAVSVMGALYAYTKSLAERSDTVDRAQINTDSIKGIINKARADNRRFLLANEGQGILAAVGVPIPQSYIAHNITEAVKYAEQMFAVGPVVMKVVSKDILHKSDVGGVALDLQNKTEVVEAYEAIINNCRNHNPNAVIDGIQVDEMVQPGTELIIGARRDQSFGPIVMFGLGGIYVEVMKDVAFRALPLNRQTIIAMIKEIKSYALLLGVRGEPPKDMEAIIDTIIKVGTIIEDNPEITDIEINPIVVYEKGVKAVDVRIMFK